jgi:hypothetical protein
MQKKFFRTLGIISFLLSFIFIANSFSGLTGFAIVEKVNSRASSFLGILFFIFGLIAILSTRLERKSKLELKVVDRSGGKDSNHDRAYLLVDSVGELGGGTITLGDFRKQVNALREEGDELVEIVRDAYGDSLKQLARAGDGSSQVAREFLSVLGEKVDEERSYVLPREEKREIIDAFRSYNGNITSNQRGILQAYGVEFITEKNHYKFKFPSGESIILSKSPSDRMAGQVIAHDLIKLIEKTKSSKKSS